MVWWLGTLLASLGTWVRSPGPPYFLLFFLITWLGTQRVQNSTMHPALELATRPIRSIQWSEAADHHVHRSTPSYTSQESPRGLAFNGPNCWQFTSKRANKPPMFVFFLFLFFLLFILITLFILIL